MSNELTDERRVTVWSRLEAFTYRHPTTGRTEHYQPGQWLIERSYPLRYARDVLGYSFETQHRHGREWRLFEYGTDPNKPVPANDKGLI
jgi:hypothetical protein